MPKTHESTEMYLETILILNEEKDGVHAVDVAERMGFSKPTVSEYLKKLRAQGLVSIDEDNHLTLTDEGQLAASAIYERHQVLAALLRHIGVSPDTAVQDACRVEHYISEETFARLKEKFEQISAK